MASVRARPQVKKDLLDIWVRIAAASPLRADRYLEMLEHRMRLLSASPSLGNLRLDPSDDRVRAHGVDNYLIVFRSAPRPIEIVRVLYDPHDIADTLQGV